MRVASGESPYHFCTRFNVASQGSPFRQRGWPENPVSYNALEVNGAGGRLTSSPVVPEWVSLPLVLMRERKIGMRLSVIVPARNEADLLGPCLQSLLAQSVEGFALNRDWELLLVDDGSQTARAPSRSDFRKSLSSILNRSHRSGQVRQMPSGRGPRRPRANGSCLPMQTPSMPPATSSGLCTKPNTPRWLCSPIRRVSW